MPEFRREEKEGESGGSGRVAAFTGCILNRFSRISVNRVHKIAFLIEYFYLDETGERITDAEYYRVMDGCRSEAITNSINELNSVQQKEISVAGESVTTVVPEQEVECSLGLDEENRELFNEIADYVTESYGGISPDEINSKMESIPPYNNAKLGEKIEL